MTNDQGPKDGKIGLTLICRLHGRRFAASAATDVWSLITGHSGAGGSAQWLLVIGHWSFRRRRFSPHRRRPAAAFTLVELILVMALLVVFIALIVPNVSRSLRLRNLEQEAARLLALTEYSRDEAASQGVPMDVWIDPDNKRFGMEPKIGYTGNTARAKTFQLNADMHFDPLSGGITVRPGTGAGTATALSQPTHGGVTAAEFAPDGTLDPTSVASIRIADRTNSGVSVTQTADGYGYQIVKDAAP